MLEFLVERLGWPEMARRVSISCFKKDPSISSSLKFLRKTGWARGKVEAAYLEEQRIMARNRKRNARRKQMRANRTPPAEQAPSGDATGD